MNICEICGKKFERPGSHRRVKTCSKECHKELSKINAYKSNRYISKEEVRCYCGNMFIKKTFNNKYCSMECANKQWKKTARLKKPLVYYKKEMECRYCGVKYSMIYGHILKYCSFVCERKYNGKRNKHGINCKNCGVLFCRIGGNYMHCSLKCAKEYMKNNYRLIEVICRRTNLEPKDIPESLIEVYREYMKLKRLLKQGGSKNDEYAGNSRCSERCC